MTWYFENNEHVEETEHIRFGFIESVDETQFNLQIGRKAMIRNRYIYLIPSKTPKGKKDTLKATASQLK